MPTSRGKIVVPGGSGYIGHLLTAYFARRDYEVVVLSRRAGHSVPGARTIAWDSATPGEGPTPGDWVAELEGAAAVINMAGRSVNCRYNAANKQAIYDSRLHSTQAIGAAIARCTAPPALWINSSSATIYRHALDREMDEATGEIGDGFSVDVCQKWERIFFEAPTPSTRKIALRSGIVIAKGSEVLEKFVMLAKLGLGSQLGPGTQFMSLIHGDDFCGAIEFLIDHNELDGIINCTGPQPIRNAEFMRLLRQLCHRPFGLPAPSWMLEIGTFLLGTESELVLKSRRVVPQYLLDAGFRFQYPTVEAALREILSDRV